ncbi:MAG TPA: DUF2550 domain-containing protein [Actinocrinis sp.]|jgi:hypothetical protein|uniref:DUF2550 domain-containing protein n=1 Tax=Actinocrinis sp. TaxID=1920516 RepID=UPI002DDCB0D0|nr:DUF2550 domain-containing protein [Actinocrinis sp.]HEV3170609.1 DUF2550 domain-containing protein [Actinocrinis sp.]
MAVSAVIAALLEGLAVACLIGLCAIGALFTRRVAIRRRGGTFDCSLRLTPASEGAARAAARFGELRQESDQRTRAHAGTHPHGSHAHSQSHSVFEPGQQPAGSASVRGPAPVALPVPRAQRGTRVPFSASGVRAGRGWSYGIAQYENDRIDWYRIFSYAYRPAAVLTRKDLEVVGRRDAEGNEELALFPGWTIVECRFGAGLVELAMSPDALTGFLSWLEAAPPGQNVSRVS